MIIPSTFEIQLFFSQERYVNNLSRKIADGLLRHLTHGRTPRSFLVSRFTLRWGTPIARQPRSAVWD
jgi:hypothetical protein